LVGDTPSSFSLIRQEDAKRARARALSMAPVKEVQKHVSAEGTVRHHIVREKRQRK
jgi:hypothetical protein